MALSSNYESVDSYNQEERSKSGKIIVYNGKVLEFYRKGGKPTIQKKFVQVIICLNFFALLPDEELPMDPPDFAIMTSIVTSALLEDGTEVPYKDCGIRVCPLVKVEGNIYKCPAQPTQKASYDLKISLNDIVGSSWSDNILVTN